VEKAEATVAVVIFFVFAPSALRPNHRDVFVVVVAVWGALVPRIVVYLSLSLSLRSPRARYNNDETTTECLWGSRGTDERTKGRDDSIDFLPLVFFFALVCVGLLWTVGCWLVRLKQEEERQKSKEERKYYTSFVFTHVWLL
jgi:hypothetical protein